MSLRRLKRSFLAALTCVVAAAFPAGAAAAGGNLGTNLGGVTYYGGQVPFTDLVRQGGEWLGASPPRTDRLGWPLSGAASMPLAEAAYPAGDYTVRWQGQGMFRVGGKTFRGSSGQGTVRLDGSSLVLLEILQTNPADHLRNIQVLTPGTAPGQVFRPRYLQSLAPYGVLRFMDWQRTNGTFADPVPGFSCRTAVAPGFISQGRRRGVSVAWMVRLSNRLDANPWFTVPHTAEDSWLRCEARYVRDHLESGLVPRFEFSNETWNPAFAQYFAMEEDGLAAGLGNGDGFLAAQLEVGLRHKHMTQVIDGEMGDRPWLSVLAGQAANSWVAQQRLSVASASTDEIAIAPYMHLPDTNLFDPADANAWADKATAAVMTALRRSLSGDVAPWIADHEALGKPLVAYEGGQHLAGDAGNDALTRLLVAANRSPAMGRLYDDYLDLWRRQTGNSLFVHYTDASTYGRFGSWGALETPDSPFTSPKYAALLRFAG